MWAGVRLTTKLEFQLCYSKCFSLSVPRVANTSCAVMRESKQIVLHRAFTVDDANTENTVCLKMGYAAMSILLGQITSNEPRHWEKLGRYVRYLGHPDLSGLNEASKLFEVLELTSWDQKTKESHQKTRDWDQRPVLGDLEALPSWIIECYRE